MTITVNPLPLGITGASTVCVGAATALTDASSGGTWTSGNTGIATVIAGSGVVTGVSAGTSIITYALGTGCEAHYVVTVNSLPPAIVGTPVLCAGAVTTLSDTTGGAWSSGNTAVATVGTGSGDVSGIAAGTATISFSLAGCVSVVGVTVNPLPASIAGTAHICSGLTATLSDGTGGGSWSSGTTTVATIGTGSGLVTTTGIGVTTIAYTLSTGCSSSVALTVNPLPSAITGANHVCVGATTALTDAGGGTWRSSNVAVATVVSGSGLVTGIAAGSATITYTLPTGCTSLISLTVNPLPVAGMITGQTILCVGSPITLSDEVSGGSWSSSDAAVATIDPTSGLVTGIATGTVSISYSVTNSCGTARSSVLDTVIDIPGAGVITGVDSVCVGDSVVLGDTVTGGIWSSSNGNATVSGTGTITGVTAGTCTISYAKTTICGTATATILVTVKSAAACKVGVGILPEMAEFKVYPNPSSGSFIVQIPETTDGSTITILDVLGKVIAQRNIKDTKMQKVSFDLLNVVPGSYTVKVNAGNNTYRQKIVIW